MLTKDLYTLKVLKKLRHGYLPHDFSPLIRKVFKITFKVLPDKMNFVFFSFASCDNSKSKACKEICSFFALLKCSSIIR